MIKPIKIYSGLLFIVIITTSCVNQITRKEESNELFCRIVGKYSRDAFIEYSDRTDASKVDDIYKYVLETTVDYSAYNLKQLENQHADKAQIMAAQDSLNVVKRKFETAIKSGEYKDKDEQVALYNNLSECDSLLDPREYASELNNIAKFQRFIAAK